MKPQKRGRSKGEKRILTFEKEKEIQTIIVDKDPMQLKFKECMRTRKNISELFFQKYEIKMKLLSSALGIQCSATCKACIQAGSGENRQVAE